MTDFVRYPKTARYSREVIVTEKIDGTNASIFIGEDGEFLTGSRKRWITPEDDNHGFSQWAHEHKEELLTMGPGRHFGEWWGSGINRGYGLPKGEKRFSVFNVTRWLLPGELLPEQPVSKNPQDIKVWGILPPCVSKVPVLWRGAFDDLDVYEVMFLLGTTGSHAAPGFGQPEGVVVYHVAGNVGFKKTFLKDNQPKSKQG